MKSWLCYLLLGFTGPFVASAETLTVLAAASLSDALSEIAPAYETSSGDKVRVVFGSSGAMARQISAGAPADVFLSADELRADQLEEAGLLQPGTRHTLLANALVLIVPVDAAATIQQPADLQRPAVRRIAVGEPATVPAGNYARAYLRQHKLWNPLHTKVVPLNNVRAVLAAVASGNADAGFVYKTDAHISPRVRIALEVPLSEGPRITYPVAIVRDTRTPAAAQAFVAFLDTAAAQAIFARYGFLPPPAP